MNPDGTMTRGPAIARYAAEHGLVALTIHELAEYRQQLALTTPAAVEMEAAA